MRVLGVDPGITNTGYGLVIEESGRMAAGECGAITTPKSADMSHRLDIVYAGVREVVARLEPETVVIEELFFNTNLKTAVSVGQARGAILLACRHSGVAWAEYTPLQVKMAVAGYGNADKDQVAFMVTSILKMKEPPASLHACDALAMAICHLNARRLEERTRNVKEA